MKTVIPEILYLSKSHFFALEWLLIILLTASCNSTNTDSFSSPESSWIEGATYNSENGKTGTMILKTDEKDYEFVNVPMDVWKKFKSAPSKGKYYHKHIRDRYQR